MHPDDGMTCPLDCLRTTMGIRQAISTDLSASRTADRHFCTRRSPAHFDRSFHVCRTSSRAAWRTRGTGDGEEVVLVKREVGEEGTLFVFGSEDEKADTTYEAGGQEEAESASTDETSAVSHGTSEAVGPSEMSSSGKETQDEPAGSSTAETPPPAVEAKQENHSPEALASLRVTDLQELCKKHEIRGYSKLKKAELVELIASELQ